MRQGAGSHESFPKALQELTDENICVLNIYLNSLITGEIPEDLKRANVVSALKIHEGT